MMKHYFKDFFNGLVAAHRAAGEWCLGSLKTNLT